MPKDTKTLGNSKARACESLGFVHKKGCARVLTQPLHSPNHSANPVKTSVLSPETGRCTINKKLCNIIRG
mgnify:CR=1 FL=1